MKLRPLATNAALAVLVAISTFFLAQQGFLSRLDLVGLDLSFRLRGNLPSNPHIVIVEITDADIAQIGRWAWPRTWHAAMVRALSDLGAKCIYFDVIFSEASAKEDDELFAESLKLSKNVYLPFAFQAQSYELENALLPLKEFSSYIKGTGAVNVEPDIDGAIRKIPLVFPGKEGMHPHIALKIAMDWTQTRIEKITPEYLLLSDSGWPRAVPGKTIKIPFAEKNRRRPSASKLLINWQGKWQNTFKHYGFLDVLNGYKDFLENKKPAIVLNDFKGAICLVGVTATGICDIKPVPLQPEYPGIGVIASSLSSILDEKFIVSPPPWANVLIICLLALLPSFLIFGEKPLRETIYVFSIGAIYFAVHFLFFKNGINLGLFYPLLGLSASSIAVETYNFVRVSKEKQTFFTMSVTDGLTGLYNIRYFKMLVETEIRMAKIEAAKRFCIVMSDVDHFKNFNDTYGHQVGDLVLKEVANVMRNSVRSSDIVARYGGEEMIALLRGGTLKDAMAVAEKIRKNVENNIVKDQHNAYKVEISLGVSAFKPTDDVETIIKRADDGLYKSKEGGRNRVSTVEEEG